MAGCLLRRRLWLVGWLVGCASPSAASPYYPCPNTNATCSRVPHERGLGRVHTRVLLFATARNLPYPTPRPTPHLLQAQLRLAAQAVHERLHDGVELLGQLAAVHGCGGHGSHGRDVQVLLHHLLQGERYKR